ncbi:MAG: MFS transporter, partial [Planctomycetota bacterium]
MNSSLLIAETSFYDLTYARFCVLHFLEFAIWGAWYVVLGNFLDARGFSRKDIGRIYGTMAVGAIISPVFVGAVADRYVSVQILIGGLHLVGAALLLAMSRLRNPRPFYWTALVYALAYTPTLALVNSVVFANVPDGVEADTYFPLIRVFGTIGWILAGMSLKLILKPNEPVSERPLLLASFLSLVLGVYSFTLPDTPPAFPAAVATAVEKGTLSPEAADQLLQIGNVQQAIDDGVLTAEQATDIPKPFEFADVFGLARELPVFLLVTLVIAMAMGFYFAFGALFLEKNTSVDPQNVGPIMTVGQIVEIAFMVSLPWFLQTLGMPTVLALGVAAWALRFGFFAIGSFRLIVAGIALHGICFDFFFTAGF